MRQVRIFEHDAFGYKSMAELLDMYAFTVECSVNGTYLIDYLNTAKDGDEWFFEDLTTDELEKITCHVKPLTTYINNAYEAECFLIELDALGWLFNSDQDANELEFPNIESEQDKPTAQECELLNKLMRTAVEIGFEVDAFITEILQTRAKYSL